MLIQLVLNYICSKRRSLTSLSLRYKQLMIITRNINQETNTINEQRVRQNPNTVHSAFPVTIQTVNGFSIDVKCTRQGLAFVQGLFCFSKLNNQKTIDKQLLPAVYFLSNYVIIAVSFCLYTFYHRFFSPITQHVTTHLITLYPSILSHFILLLNLILLSLQFNVYFLTVARLLGSLYIYRIVLDFCLLSAS